MVRERDGEVEEGKCVSTSNHTIFKRIPDSSFLFATYAAHAIIHVTLLFKAGHLIHILLNN